MSTLVSACSSSATHLTPPEQARVPSGKTAAATFTIKWSNPTASAALRRTKTISPSAQSISITVNGKLTAVANRNGSPTQSIAIDAPVGIDAFAFTVYDQTNAAGHLLGTATVTQQIVDGAANAVAASIVATCAATNVSYANDDLLSITKFAPGGSFSQILQSILLAGQSPATLVAEPQDADGNVIITTNGGIVTGSITGSATVTPIDGAHLRLTPATGPRTTSPDTLTVSAPGCPPATVAVQHSPAIYFQSTVGTNNITIEDWFGDVVLAGAIDPSSVLIGYDTHLKKMVAYNKTSGQVTEYSPDLRSSAALYAITPGAVATWSNYANGIFDATSTYVSPSVYNVQYSIVQGGAQTMVTSQHELAPVQILAAATFSSGTYGFSSDGAHIFEVNLATRSAPIVDPYLVTSPPSALSADDPLSTLVILSSSGGAYVKTNPYPAFNSELASNDGLAAYAYVGAVDTDDNDLYVVDTNNYSEAVTAAGAPLSGFFQLQSAVDSAIVVVSANEN